LKKVDKEEREFGIRINSKTQSAIIVFYFYNRGQQ